MEIPWEDPVLLLWVTWATTGAEVYLVFTEVTLTEEFGPLVAFTWALTEAKEDLDEWHASSQVVTVVVVNLLTWATAEAEAADLAEWHFSLQTVATVVVREVIVTGWAASMACSVPIQVVIVSLSVWLSVTVFLVLSDSVQVVTVSVSVPYLVLVTVSLVHTPFEHDVMVAISVAMTELVLITTVLLLMTVECSVTILLEVIKEEVEGATESAEEPTLVISEVEADEKTEDWEVISVAEEVGSTADVDSTEEVDSAIEVGWAAEVDSMEEVDSASTEEAPIVVGVAATDEEEEELVNSLLLCWTEDEYLISTELEVSSTGILAEMLCGSIFWVVEDVDGTEEVGGTIEEVDGIADEVVGTTEEELEGVVEEVVGTTDEVVDVVDDVVGTTDEVVDVVDEVVGGYSEASTLEIAEAISADK